MPRPPPCVLARVLQDVASLMTQHATRDGAQFYEIAREWLWDRCESERKFTATRVLLIMDGMIHVLNAMPTTDQSVADIQAFLQGMCSQVTAYGLTHDPRGENEDYDYHVLNRYRYDPIQP